MLKLPVRIALRYLKTPGLNTFSSFTGLMAMIGLALGVAALILTSGILTGFENTLSEKIAGFDGHIRIQHFMNQALLEHPPEMDEVARKAARSESGNSIQPFIQKPALIRRGSLAEGVLVEGVSGSGSEALIVEGRWDLSGNSIVMGRRLAEMLDISIGDKVALFDLESMAAPLGSRRIHAFKVAGLIHSGLHEYDRSLIYVNLKAAQQLFGMEDQVSGWVVRSSNSESIHSLAQNFEEILSYPYYVQTYLDKHRILFTWLNVQKWPIFILFGLITLVGLVNIMAALAMIIFEKTGDVGTLKALGMPNRTLRFIFLTKGAVIGVGGSMLGLFTALSIGFMQDKFGLIPIPEEVYFMDRIPIGANPVEVITILVLAVFGSIAAAVWPTIKAARVQPAQALRYE